METTSLERDGQTSTHRADKRAPSCPRCARPIPAAALMGLCPACLMGTGIEALRGAFDETAEVPATVPQLRRRQPGQAASGRLFGPFELGELLGSGGMGEVYKARDLRMGRDVALKKLHTGARTSEALLRRFQEEIKAFARLDHPYIVMIHEAGEHRGEHYFTMKLLPGDLRKRRSLFEGDPRGAAALMAKIAGAVHHLHDRGILHLDLKPANILLDDESPPNPYVTDFGIAGQMGEDGCIPGQGVFMGTLRYSAPEQDSCGDVTRAADIYSLGVILHELLTQQRLFPGDTDSEIRAAKEKPIKDPREISPDVDRDLARICLRCLEREPGKRYPSAKLLADALNRYLRGEPSEEAGRAERAARWALRRPVTTGLIVAVLLFLGLATTRAIPLVGRQEAQRQAQIQQANMNSAAMVAGTVLSQLRMLSDAVERAGRDGGFARGLENKDYAALNELCESTFEYYDDPSHGINVNGRSPFNMWFILDRDGFDRGQFSKPIQVRSLGKFYGWRDYFMFGWKLGERGLRAVHVSRAIQSENDRFFKFVISTPIHAKDGRTMGILGAGVAADAYLGSLALDDDQSIAVLVAPRDRDRGEPRPRTPYIILRHPAFAYGEGAGMDNELVRRVSGPDLDNDRRMGQELWLPSPDRVISTNDYLDPVAATHPEYAGKWLAGFAPVGHTGFVVIVQSREEEATRPERTLARQLMKWTAISMSPGLFLVLFATVYSRRRRRDKFPS